MPWEVLCLLERHDPVTTELFGARHRTLPASAGKSTDGATRGPSRTDHGCEVKA